ncbi:MAG: MFS transporter [Lentisphaeria bacterium]
MIKRFSFYGFLKNQRYFAPFLLLAFLEKGLHFSQIGFLIGFRELAINLMELPSGAIADTFGHRKSMIASFSAYIVAFLCFGFAAHYWEYFIAMFFFAIGEVFRSGTHKAMIFTWLRLHHRIQDKTKVYGFTRSWSLIGSAVSAILASIMVFQLNNYTAIFFFSIIPYGIGILNFLTYPKELDGDIKKDESMKLIYRRLIASIKKSFAVPGLRHLIFENMEFEGFSKATKDYLQIIIKTMAMSLPFFLAYNQKQRSAILICGVYVILYLGSSIASRRAHCIVEKMGGEEKASHFLWIINLSLYIILLPALYFNFNLIAITGFILLTLLDNLWRPIIIGRFDPYAQESDSATILSIESQAQSFATMLIAPVLGFLIDFIAKSQTCYNEQNGILWPIAMVGITIDVFALISEKRNKNTKTA